jgi:hypothetical protein
MNERIKELAVEAGANYYSLGNRFEEFDEHKFAELIVRECIDWCNAHARDDGTAQRIAEDIKLHFGVEP